MVKYQKLQMYLHEKLQTKGVKTYLTGSDLIAGDFLTSSQEGVKKTEVISIIFILVDINRCIPFTSCSDYFSSYSWCIVFSFNGDYFSCC